MRILITGVKGQLGYDVKKAALAQGIDAVGIDRETVDLTKSEEVASFFATHEPFDAIIHCAAYTAVDAAEDDAANAQKINVDATGYLVEAAREQAAKFIYISTDYVYPGDGDTPYTEASQTGPTSVYGVTKLAGEDVARSYDKSYVVRISWVFGINGNNFIKTMLRLSAERDELTIVDDQVGSPTYTFDIAPKLLEMAKAEKYGTYNMSNEGFCSWYEFANEIFSAANIEVKTTPVTSEAFVTKAIRPKNSRMSKQKLIDNGFGALPHWKVAVKNYLDELDREAEKH